MGAELEEKIRDLETTISNQSQAMLEMGRRVEIYKKEADTSRKWNSTLSLNIGKSNNDTMKDSPTIQEGDECPFNTEEDKHSQTREDVDNEQSEDNTIQSCTTDAEAITAD